MKALLSVYDKTGIVDFGSGLAKAGYSLVELFQLQEGVPKIIVGFGKFRLDRNGLETVNNGFVQPADFLEPNTQIVVRIGVIGINVDCGSVVNGCFLQPANFVERNS